MQQQVPASVPAEFENGVPENTEMPFPPPPGAFLTEPKKSNWATLNLILAIWGYRYVGALLSPLSEIWGLTLEDSWLVNYSIRALQIAVAAYCIFVVARRKFGEFKWTGVHTFLLIILLADYLRLFYDWTCPGHLQGLERTLWQLNVLLENPWKGWCYRLVEFLAFYSVVKTIHLVDFDKFIRWMFLGGFIGCIFSLWTLDQTVAMEETIKNINIDGQRANSGVTLHTLSLGSYGMTCAMISAYCFLEKGGKNIVKKILFILGALLGLYVCLQSGSRGIFISFFAVVGFYLMTRFRHAIFTVPIVAVLAGLMWLVRYQVVDFLGIFNPVVRGRLLMTLESGDSSGRTDLWLEYLQVIKTHPIIGAHGDPGAHNQLLDCLTEFGIFFGWVAFVPTVLAVVYSWKLLKSKNVNWWPVFFMVGPAFHGIVSGGFHGGESFLLIIVALYILRTHTSRQFSPYIPSHFN